MVALGATADRTIFLLTGVHVHQHTFRAGHFRQDGFFQIVRFAVGVFLGACFTGSPIDYLVGHIGVNAAVLHQAGVVRVPAVVVPVAAQAQAHLGTRVPGHRQQPDL